MDTSDTVCISILRGSTSALVLSAADPLINDITETQYRNVRDQRIAMASKIHTKFQVSSGDREELVKFDGKIAMTKYVTFDPSAFEQDALLSYRDHFKSSEDVQKIANQIRRIIHEDLVVAHADNVCKLSEKFNQREMKELEELCYLGKTYDSECAHHEIAREPDNFEESIKYLIMSFEDPKCNDDWADLDLRSIAIGEMHPCKIDETHDEIEEILKHQIRAVQNFRYSEADSMMSVVADCGIAAGNENSLSSVGKFVCVPTVEYDNRDNNFGTKCILAEISEFCTSIMIQTSEENSLNVGLPEQSIFICVQNGIQNYTSLMEIFAPSKNPNDDMEEFSLPTLEAIPHETPEEIPARSAKNQLYKRF
jgi:predicted nucleic acid-binding protein